MTGQGGQAMDDKNTTYDKTDRTETSSTCVCNMEWREVSADGEWSDCRCYTDEEKKPTESQNAPE